MDVLVVESKPNDAFWISERIIALGHCVTAVKTVKEAANIADYFAYDLVVMNLNLSDADGIELIRYLKRAWQKTRIVAVADSGSDELELKARENGVIYYMPKPVDEDRLRNIVEHVAVRLAEEKNYHTNTRRFFHVRKKSEL